MRFDDTEVTQQVEAPPVQEAATPLDDAALREVVTRLARSHRSGGRVVERAALMASGTDFSALLRWIEAHDGVPEEAAASSTRVRRVGLIDDRQPPPNPLRFVLPASAFA